MDHDSNIKQLVDYKSFNLVGKNEKVLFSVIHSCFFLRFFFCSSKSPAHCRGKAVKKRTDYLGAT